MRFNEWLEKEHPEFNEGFAASAAYAILQSLWQYYGGIETGPSVDQFMDYAIRWLTYKLHLAEPQAVQVTKQFLCKAGVRGVC